MKAWNFLLTRTTTKYLPFRQNFSTKFPPMTVHYLVTRLHRLDYVSMSFCITLTQFISISRDKTSDKTNIGRDKLLKCLVNLYSLSFYLNSPFKKYIFSMAILFSIWYIYMAILFSIYGYTVQYIWLYCSAYIYSVYMAILFSIYEYTVHYI